MVNSRSKLHNVATPDVELRDGVDIVIDSIGARQSIVPPDNIGVTIQGVVTSPMRHANRFEYLAISEALTDEVVEVSSTDASTDEVVELVSNGTVIPDITEYSDSSPFWDSFKHVKRIDELDYTPHPLPLSKSKLKRLKKLNRVLQREDGSNVSCPHA